jgi:hypothetical protein
VDRDTRTGFYGGDRIYVNRVDWAILEKDSNSRTLLCKPVSLFGALEKRTFHLQQEESDLEIWQSHFLEPWNDYYKEDYANDEDYPDYEPQVYATWQDLLQGKHVHDPRGTSGTTSNQ